MSDHFVNICKQLSVLKKSHISFKYLVVVPKKAGMKRDDVKARIIVMIMIPVY